MPDFHPATASLLATKEAANSAEYPIDDEAKRTRDPDPRAFGSINEVITRHNRTILSNRSLRNPAQQDRLNTRSGLVV
jgi:hypothetical protein